MIRKRGTVEFKGQLITTAELARLHALPVSTIAHRYWRGDRDDLLVRPTKTAKTKASCPTCGVEFVKINDQRRVFCSAACMKNRGGRGISRPVTHGETYTRLYRIWHSMKKRCNPNLTNPNPNYAGKGIRVCEEWLQYEPFRDWALSHGYSDDLEIDRAFGEFACLNFPREGSNERSAI